MPVVFEAAEDAPIDGDLVDFRGKLADPNKPTAQSKAASRITPTLCWASRMLLCTSAALRTSCAMAVTEKVPFRLEIVQPKVPLVRSGTMNFKVVVHRDEGFDGANLRAVSIYAAWRWCYRRDLDREGAERRALSLERQRRRDARQMAGHGDRRRGD